MALAQDPIVVGAPIPITGPFANDGISIQMATDLAVEDISLRCGPVGQPLKASVFDLEDLPPDKRNTAGTNLVAIGGAAVHINSYGGIFNLDQITFLAIGGYASAMCSVHAGVPTALTLVLATAIAAAVGLVRGRPFPSRMPLFQRLLRILRRMTG